MDVRFRSGLFNLLFGLFIVLAGGQALAESDFCWSETTPRGIGLIPTTCGVDQERNGALCYPRCPAGYSSDGVAGCIQSCPPGARDDGLFCGWPSYKAAEYPAWDAAKCRANHSTGCWQTVPTIGVWVENCRAGFRHVAGFCEKETINCSAEGLAGNRIANSCAKRTFFRTVSLPTCDASRVNDAGLCYTPCVSGAGAGPMCWQSDPPIAGWVQCGAGWAKDQKACDAAIASQVISVLDMAVSTTMLIGSLGASSATITLKKTTGVFSKQAWTHVSKIGKAGAKAVVVDVAKATATGAIPSVADAVLTTTNGAIDNLWEIGRLEHETPTMTAVERDMAIARVAMNTASWFDPTGMTGVIAAYLKPVCKDISRPDPMAPGTVSGQVSTVLSSAESLDRSYQIQIESYRQQITSANNTIQGLTAKLGSSTATERQALQQEIAKLQAERDSAQRLLTQAESNRVTVSQASQKFVSLTRNQSTATGTPSWGPASYAASDIAAGANGSVWFIGTDGPGAGPDRFINRVTPSGVERVPGAALRIAVDPNGIPWVINSTNTIFRWNGTGWQQLPGQARDIGIGSSGAVWVIGLNGSPYRWNGSNWTMISGTAAQISVDASGNPWVVNAGNQIYRFDGANWTLLPGAARDIGIGADGAVYVTGVSGTAAGAQVYRWQPSSSTWVVEAGVAGLNVAGGPAGTAYVTRGGGQPVMERIRR
jgi:hypothetical protein